MELPITFTDLIGYIASAVVLASFLMKNLSTLRTVNAIGAFIFVIYGCLLNISWPIIITNTAIIGINLYYLLKGRK